MGYAVWVRVRWAGLGAERMEVKRNWMARSERMVKEIILAERAGRERVAVDLVWSW